MYTSYIHSLNSVAGHPLHVFLTPELHPVFGGTYFAPPGAGQRDGSDDSPKVPDFLQILTKVQSAWEKEHGRIVQDGQGSIQALREVMNEGVNNHASDEGDAGVEELEVAYTRMRETFDTKHGGFIHIPISVRPQFFSGNVDIGKLRETFDRLNKTPRFTTTPKLTFLIEVMSIPQVYTDIIGDELVSDVFDHGIKTLRAIASRGLRDHVGRGFYHYSQTRDWSLPCFEKTLCDNALLLGIFHDAWVHLTKKEAPQATCDEFRAVFLELADYLTTAPIRLPGSGLATSEAADSPAKRGHAATRPGAYYLWTKREFDEVIGDEQQSAVAAAYWNVKEHGNVNSDPEIDPHDDYLNQNVLCVAKTFGELAAQFSIPESDAVKLVESAREKLAAHRQAERVQPFVDEKVVVAYNGMAISALARVGATLRKPGNSEADKQRGTGYVEAAVKVALFIKSQLWDAKSGTLYRFHYGSADRAAFADDYAFLIDGLLKLSEATNDGDWLTWADELQQAQIARFYDDPSHARDDRHAACGGFYCTAEDAQHIILRVKDGMDKIQPSTNSVSASNLLNLSKRIETRSKEYRDLASQTIRAFDPDMVEFPQLFPGLLTVMVRLL